MLLSLLAIDFYCRGILFSYKYTNLLEEMLASILNEKRDIPLQYKNQSLSRLNLNNIL